MGLIEGHDALGNGAKTVWANPAEIMRVLQPENPVMAFSPTRLERKAHRFLAGFPGLVTYAVKSNPDEIMIRTLIASGIKGFDIASPYEMELVGRIAPNAARHYHNPVRARHEIAHAVRAGISSWSVDSLSELEKLFEQVPVQGVEISARFTLPVLGAAYDFGSKFGAAPDLAADLLRRVADRGYIPSLAFHPGTQCTDPAAWGTYIGIAAEIAQAAAVTIRRLNVGGGFPSHRVQGIEPDLEAIFALIDQSTTEAFGTNRPELVCEPGRGLCADAYALITRVKAVRDGNAIFLNDGVYGALMELPIIGNIDRVQVFDTEGRLREGDLQNRTIFGPTCDSVDRLPGELALSMAVSEGDFVVFQGAGAYSSATNTRFNGFGQMSLLTVMDLE